jgi:hypothetical protein
MLRDAAAGWLGLHGVRIRSVRCLVPFNKVVDDGRPALLLVPETESLVLQRFQRELEDLIPRVLCDDLDLGRLLNIFQPQVEPVLGSLPMEPRRREKHLPSLGTEALVYGALALRLELELESVLVHFFELVGNVRCADGGLQRSNVALLLGNRVDAGIISIYRSTMYADTTNPSSPQPLTKPSLVTSPNVGLWTMQDAIRHVMSERSTPMSLKYFCTASMPRVSPSPPEAAYLLKIFPNASLRAGVTALDPTKLKSAS